MKKFNLVLKLQFRSKYFKYNILLISLVTLIILIINIYSCSANMYLKNKTYNESVWFKSFEVTPLQGQNLDDAIIEVMKIPHVTNVVKFYEYSAILNSKFLSNKMMTGDIIIYASSNKSLPSEIKGLTFPEETGNYLICPSKLYASSNLDSLRFMNRKYVINTKELLNEDVEFKYFSNYKSNEYIEKYKIIGMYDALDISDNNVCFARNDTLTKIIKNQYSDDIDLSTGENKLNDQSTLYVQIDNFNNLDKVKKNLSDLGYRYIDTAKVRYDYFNNIESITTKMTFSISIIMFIVIFIIFFKQYKDEKYFLKLLYIIGYSSKDILSISFISSLILVICSIFISIILFAIIYFLGVYIIEIYPFLLNGWRFNINYISLTLIMFLLICVSIVINIFKMKLLKYKDY